MPKSKSFRERLRQMQESSEHGKTAKHLLRQLAQRSLKVRPDDAPLADALLAEGLAFRRTDDSYEITAAGWAHLSRLELASAGIDPFLGQHLRLCRVEEGGPGTSALTIDLNESPLAWLARRKGRDGRPLIEPVQLQAGERLRADFTRAQMAPRVTVNWSASAISDRNGNGITHLTDGALAARQRLRHAFDAVGPEFTGLLLDVCCFLKRLDDVERERNWPARSAKVVLQLGLDRLARHYGYVAQTRGPAHGALRAWAAADGPPALAGAHHE